MAPKAQPKAKGIWSKNQGQEDVTEDGGPKVPTASIGITIAGASKLRNADRFGTSDPFCVCEVVDEEDDPDPIPGRKVIETRVIDGNSDPQWDHRDMFSDYVPGERLRFTVYDYDGPKKRTSLGSVILESSDFYPAGLEDEVELEGTGKSWGKKIDAKLNLKIFTLRAAADPKQPKASAKKAGGYDDDDNDSYIELDIAMPKDPYDDARAARRRRDPFIDDVIREGQDSGYPRPSMAGQGPRKSLQDGVRTDDMIMTMAVIKIQRNWRKVSANWLSARVPVKLPPSAEDMADRIPTALSEPGPRRGAHQDTQTHGRDVTWHGRLCASAAAVRGAGASSASKRCAAQIQHLSEVGRFVAACRAISVLSVHATLLDPFGTASGKADEHEHKDKLPRRITRDDPLWPHLRGRFDADRVYVLDSIVLTILGGDVIGNMDMETAWRIYQHDMSGLQSLADTLHGLDTLNPVAPPFGVFVDYLGFRVLCRPQVLFVGSRPPELVIGPVAEASSALGGPGDFPEMYRQAAATQRVEVSLLVNSWEETHQDLRYDMEMISKRLRLQGLPVTLDSSDLPENVVSTAIVRIGGQLHFRTPCELLPPEVLTDAGLADPTRRIRREALEALGAPPLPSTHRLSATVAGDSGVQIMNFSAYARAELPRRFLQRLEAEGHPLDSRGWTEALHSAGLNCRHIGWVMAKAPPAVASALAAEGLARAAKWIYRNMLWTRVPWAFLATQNTFEGAVGPEPIAVTELVKLFNLILGGGADAHSFWNKQLLPETVRRFAIAATAIEKPRVFAGGLFLALQYHLKVKFKASASSKPLFSPGLPEPFSVDDLLGFRSAIAANYFPHLQAVQERLVMLQQRYALERAPKIQLRGFLPEAKIICARGPEWHLATSSPAKHIQEGRWDRAYEALNLRLSMARAIGDPTPVVGGILQGIAVALIKLAKSAEPEMSSVIHIPQTAALIKDEAGHDQTIAAEKFGKLMDADKALHAMWAADAAQKLLPNVISAWWSQLAAVESEWLIGRHVAAESRMARLQKEWDRFAIHQPILQLRLNDTFARLLASDGDWRGAAGVLDKCSRLSELSFGRLHPATISYYARLGDSWSRKEEWMPATRAFREALALAEAMNDQLAAARIGYELANVLHRYGDISAAKAHAENVVWTVLPRLHAGGDPQSGLANTPGGAFAMDALHLLGRIYEDIFLRASELKGAAGLSQAEQREIGQRSISCYEALLRQMPLQMKKRGERLSKEGHIVESILRLKTINSGPAEKAILEDAIEGLIISSSVANDPKMAAMKGVRALQPRLQTRAVASAALRTATSDLPSRIDALCEAVARDAAINGLTPSGWFDVVLGHLSEGNYHGFTTIDDPMHKSTLQLLDLCRHFLGDMGTIF